MTILHKDFYINVSAGNIKCEADNPLQCIKGQKIHLHLLQISPQNTPLEEDVYIMLYRDAEQLEGEGIYQAIIDDTTHIIPVDGTITEGQKFVVKAWSANSRIIRGVFEYEIFE